jgi:hypothetical protein
MIYLLNLQFETLLILAGQMRDLQNEIYALRKSQQDTTIAVNAILQVLQEDYEEFPPRSLN